MLERLDRIDTMRRANAGPVELLGELRRLLHEAESWARAEGGDAARGGDRICETRSTGRVPGDLRARADGPSGSWPAPATRGRRHRGDRLGWARDHALGRARAGAAGARPHRGHLAVADRRGLALARGPADPRRPGPVGDAAAPRGLRGGDLLRARWIGRLAAVGRRAEEAFAVGAGDCLVHLALEHAHTIGGGPDGLDVLAFGERHYAANTLLPRAGVSWLGPTWVLAGRARRPPVGARGCGRPARGGRARREARPDRERRGRCPRASAGEPRSHAPRATSGALPARSRPGSSSTTSSPASSSTPPHSPQRGGGDLRRPRRWGDARGVAAPACGARAGRVALRARAPPASRRLHRRLACRHRSAALVRGRPRRDAGARVRDACDRTTSASTPAPGRSPSGASG